MNIQANLASPQMYRPMNDQHLHQQHIGPPSNGQYPATLQHHVQHTTQYYGSVPHQFSNEPSPVHYNNHPPVVAPNYIPVSFNEDSYRPTQAHVSQRDPRSGTKRYFSQVENHEPQDFSRHPKRANSSNRNFYAETLKPLASTSNPTSTSTSASTSTSKSTSTASKSSAPSSVGTPKATTANNDPATFYCEICRVKCTGKESYDQHLAGARHRRAEQAEPAAVSKPLTIEPADLSRAISSAREASNAQTVTPEKAAVSKQSSSFYCDVCRVKCSGKEAYEQHLAGARHFKAVQVAAQREAETKVSTPPPTADDRNANTSAFESPKALTIDCPKESPTKESSTFDCALCRCRCTGKEAYDQHLTGARHRKAEANKSTSDSVSSNTSILFKCDLCNVICSGPESFKAHLDGSKHARVARLAKEMKKEIPCDTSSALSVKPIQSSWR